jgi:hypothetical protein
MGSNFEKISTKAERSKQMFRQSKESQCGEKVKMPKHIARQLADKQGGRAYHCKYCNWWHFSLTEFLDWRE